MGENIIITKTNGNRVPLQSRRTATRVTQGKQTWALNADDKLEITVESPFPQHYDIGDSVTVFGRVYRLNRLPKESKTGMHEFSYDLEFEGVQYDLLRAHYNVTIDTTKNVLQDVTGDSLTGDLHLFLEVLVANANRVFPGKWAIGACPDTAKDKTLTFGESDNCLMVLQTLCNTSNFNVEFEIRTVNGVNYIDMKERVGQTLPYTFRFGRGGGLYSLKRDNVSDANIVTRLNVYGSTSNITHKYRADRLCLPGKSKNQSFIEKKEAVAKYGIFEGRKNFDNIKPSFTGHAKRVVGNVVQFIDKTFPFDLNAKNGDGLTKYLIAGQEAKIHFNTGNLAGYDFTIAKYDHSTHTFTLNKFTDDRGNVFPSDTSEAFQFSAKEDDEYKITDVTYPDDIIFAAEKQLEEQATKWYDQNCQPKVAYSLDVTKQWLERMVGGDDTHIVNVFAPGDFLHIVDEDIVVDKAVRIKSFTRNLLDPYNYSLTISDITTNANTTARVLSELIDIDKVLTINHLQDPARARANWRSSREILDMVFDPDGDYYTDKIKPNSVDTLALSVGAKSMQFGLTNTVFQPNYQGNKSVVKWQGGVLTHYTINEHIAVSWVLADGEVWLDNDDDAFYIYARCNRTGTDGTIVFTKEQHKTADDANYYYFWIGVLNSVDADLKARSIALSYGFTMVNGRFIKTGRIESADGTTYFDLDNSEIGGRIVFTSNGKEKTLAELGAEALESKDFINNTLPGLLSDLQEQLDGQIEQFFYENDPDNSLEPTKTWIDTDMAAGNNNEKEKHTGDLFYNVTSGKVFRYMRMNKTPRAGVGYYWQWQELSDSEVSQALVVANDALALSKTKRRIFTSTPYTPYEVGDLWCGGANGDILRCKSARASGAFSTSDWELASKYTDNSALNTFKQTYAVDKANVIAQLDGKIETWFQASDPATSWTTTATKKNHVGDMWYNAGTRELKYYTKNGNTYEWKLVEDAKAIAAYEAASKAQDTADGKRQVFVATPKVPYDIGDLWVDGTDLRRCITKKTATQAYNVNDWVVAVAYDNTKTTIDGGLVTSGTLQVAGDNKSILAGITGQGTAASAVRFWAGASFENRATAPFRVLQDGSVVMTKANVEGVINALSGKIGGFKITDGAIGYGGNDEQDKTNGMKLLNSFIRFVQSGQETRIGTMNQLGFSYNAYFNLTNDMGTTMELHHKLPTTSSESLERFYLPLALYMTGNMKHVGKSAVYDKGYIGSAYTDTIVSWFEVTHKFHFTGNTTSYLGVDLPTKTQIDKATGNANIVFDFELVCDKSMPNRLKIRSQTGAQMYNNDGGAISGLDMERGDSITLRYYNGAYMVVNKQCET